MRRAPRRFLALLLTAALGASLATPGELAAQLFPGFEPPPVQDQPPPRPRAQKKAPKKARKKAPQKAAKKPAEQPKKGKKKKEVPSKDPRVWNLGREAGFPVLAFGTSAAPVISFACQPETGNFRVIVFGLARGVKAGDSARMRLRNGPTRIEVAGTAVPTETKGTVDIAGVTRTAPRLFALFRTGEIIAVEVPGRTFNVPLKTLPNKAEPFERACVARR